MVNEQAHAHIIEGFARVFTLCGEVRGILATMRSRMGQQGFTPSEDANPFRLVSDLERAATALMREYVSWASPLDVSGGGE